MVMYAQVGLLVHALSILNFDGLYSDLYYTKKRGPPNSPTAHLSDGPLVRQPISPTVH